MMARMQAGTAPAARRTTTAVYVDERGILLHDTWQGHIAPPLQMIDAPELRRLPEPEVIEIDAPATVIAPVVDSGVHITVHSEPEPRFSDWDDIRDWFADFGPALVGIVALALFARGCA